MAYMTPLSERNCFKEHCPKKATHEVRNNRNEKIGEFCHLHGAQMVDELEGYEKRDAEQRRIFENVQRFYDG